MLKRTQSVVRDLFSYKMGFRCVERHTNCSCNLLSSALLGPFWHELRPCRFHEPHRLVSVKLRPHRHDRLNSWFLDGYPKLMKFPFLIFLSQAVAFSQSNNEGQAALDALADPKRAEQLQLAACLTAASNSSSQVCTHHSTHPKATDPLPIASLSAS